MKKPGKMDKGGSDKGKPLPPWMKDKTKKK